MKEIRVVELFAGVGGFFFSVFPWKIEKPYEQYALFCSTLFKRIKKG